MSWITEYVGLIVLIVPNKILVFHVKDVKTGFVEIVYQRVSNKIIHFIVQNTIAFFNFIGEFLILYSCLFLAIMTCH
ncbi:hypothetical protein BpHYR1_018161 [Brachionus plicatilis]|uniref:Uncharacterized protein n=1 Tax=Brachionus plicatilis TaxID=10195 RepID=A0A3M7Q5L3_BRAPC|nr:hypothetical protein BpHYR1_018161 [Brachionus plicatilis]